MIEMPEQAALERIAHVASESDEEPITHQVVTRVLAAFINVMEGDPVGTLLRDPESGAVAVRVNADGLHIWRVSDPNGSQYNDLQPTLAGWDKIG